VTTSLRFVIDTDRQCRGKIAWNEATDTVASDRVNESIDERLYPLLVQLTPAFSKITGESLASLAMLAIASG